MDLREIIYGFERKIYMYIHIYVKFSFVLSKSIKVISLIHI